MTFETDAIHIQLDRIAVKFLEAIKKQAAWPHLCLSYQDVGMDQDGEVDSKQLRRQVGR